MSAWIGVAGTLLGFFLNAAYQWRREDSANHRADVVWRREKYVDAVAEFVHVARDMTSLSCAVSRAVFADMNASGHGDPRVVASTRESLVAVQGRYDPLVEEMSRARALVEIYAPGDVRAKADAVWTALNNNGSFPDIHDMGAFERRVLSATNQLISEVTSDLP